MPLVCLLNSNLFGRPPLFSQISCVSKFDIMPILCVFQSNFPKLSLLDFSICPIYSPKTGKRISFSEANLPHTRLPMV